MKRIPRGFPADHPRAGLLRHRSLTAARELEAAAVGDAEPVYRTCERLRPLLTWIVAEPFVLAAISRKLALFADPFGNLIELSEVVG
jgi:hypothetical protein